MFQSIQVTSDAFAEGETIPAAHTCDGANVSPRIEIAGLPAQCVSWALLCDDPDAPAGDWVHWLVFNLPPDALALPRDVSPVTLRGFGAGVGRNSWGENRYQGPCPPGGKHRYFFKVYALDTTLALPAKAGKAEFLAAAEGHTLAYGSLMGRYARQR